MTALIFYPISWIGKTVPHDGDRIRREGGLLLVMNHISHLDPPVDAVFVHRHGRVPRFLAKESLFRTPVFKYLIKGAGSIPVARRSVGAAESLHAANEALDAGRLVVIYPEGTITKDPDGWPMRGKTGAARIALATGCPVIPIGQWGVQDLLPAYASRPHLFPRKTTAYKVGDPVDLSDLMDKPVTSEVLHEATDRIMAAVTALAEELRGEKAPAVRFDPKTSGVTEIGNPNKKKRKS
jgi:1-acyl-sn-glycerol-3-phosphate acyltransferase